MKKWLNWGPSILWWGLRDHTLQKSSGPVVVPIQYAGMHEHDRSVPIHYVRGRKSYCGKFGRRLSITQIYWHGEFLFREEVTDFRARFHGYSQKFDPFIFQ